MNTEYKGHKIYIGQPYHGGFVGGRNRWYREIKINGQYATANQHKSCKEALWFAQRIIEARLAEEGK